MGTIRSAEAIFDRALPVVSEDRELVRELQAGSEEAFISLLGVYQNPVYNFILHIVGNPADAADVLQEVFVKIFKGVRQFHGESNLKTWIYRIAVHEALNQRRGSQRRHRHEPISLDEDFIHGEVAVPSAQSGAATPYQLMEQAERQLVVTRALASLADPYRTVVILREIQGFSYEEIAHVLGLAEGTVKSRLMRGRELLRRKLNGCSIP
jgi:RNA polymerase sigma-70 factor (ECF subfamily)